MEFVLLLLSNLDINLCSNEGGIVYLLLLLVFYSDILYLLHIIFETKLYQSLDNMIGRDGLFCFTFADFIGFGRNEVYEFHAAVDKQVSRLLGECQVRGEKFRYE